MGACGVEGPFFPAQRGDLFRDGTIRERLSCLEGCEASWWGEIYGQSFNPLISSADIYPAPAMGWALS